MCGCEVGAVTAIQIIAAEIAPQLDAALTEFIETGDPEPREKLIGILWDNKVGILRVLQAAIADPVGPS